MPFILQDKKGNPLNDRINHSSIETNNNYAKDDPTASYFST